MTEASVCVARPRACASLLRSAVPSRLAHPPSPPPPLGGVWQFGGGVGSLSLTLVLTNGVAIGQRHEPRDYPGLLSPIRASRAGTQ